MHRESNQNPGGHFHGCHEHNHVRAAQMRTITCALDRDSVDSVCLSFLDRLPTVPRLPYTCYSCPSPRRVVPTSVGYPKLYRPSNSRTGARLINCQAKLASSGVSLGKLGPGFPRSHRTWPGVYVTQGTVHVTMLLVPLPLPLCHCLRLTAAPRLTRSRSLRVVQ